MPTRALPGANFVQNPEISLENDANQIGDFASANWPSDPADEATDIATSLYSMSFGVFGTNPNASTATIETGTVPAGDPSSLLGEDPNGQRSRRTPLPESGANSYPLSRTLFNIYRTDTVRASTAGFLNWLCDSNSSIQKGTDHIDGGNFDTDLTNTINGTYGFSRVSDLTQEVANDDSGKQRGRWWRRCDVRCTPLHSRRWNRGRQHHGDAFGGAAVHGRRWLGSASCARIQRVDPCGRQDPVDQRHAP